MLQEAFSTSHWRIWRLHVLLKLLKLIGTDIKFVYSPISDIIRILIKSGNWSPLKLLDTLFFISVFIRKIFFTAQLRATVTVLRFVCIYLLKTRLFSLLLSPLPHLNTYRTAFCSFQV